MPMNVQLDKLPAGICTHGALPNQTVSITTTGFVSSEDGDELISGLEGISDMLLSPLINDRRLFEPMIDHLVAIVRKDRTATIYVNELQFVATIQSKRALKAGEKVFSDDIADIIRIEAGVPPIAADAGLVVVLSHRWRKGLFYDFTPFNPGVVETRERDLGKIFAFIQTYLSYQDRLRLSDTDWDTLINLGWFPFTSIRASTIKQMLTRARLSGPVDDLLDEIETQTRSRAETLVEHAKAHRLFEGHRSVVATALGHFLKREYLSCTGLLFPRIEGVLRSYYASTGHLDNATQKRLTETATVAAAAERHGASLLLPSRFESYLQAHFFGHFDPANPKGLSRHTIAHGVCPEDDMGRRAAVLGVLILDQLFFLTCNHWTA